MIRIPVAVLLAGVTGSGKTTLSETLATYGMIRASVDEEVFRTHGRYGIDYPEDGYYERESAAVGTVRNRLIGELATGRDVVLDHGLWTRAERRHWQSTVRDAGGIPVLVYLPVSYGTALARLTERNQREDANALTVSPEALRDFFDRFDIPGDEEGAVTYGQDPAGLLRIVERLRSSAAG
ncbi:putative kinase [Arthrobacter silviterrae]|uniref:ATP-binding protein n=1 Tax=Arthrobacter silviterrae TaxID=2026658 RepID=A0ABX0DHI5_9MICC|nr:ATP-binding protein [Arthrobacter silviterrae]MDQ0278917.1 putative kinase [Arthrobacter silviterrae]NGN84020.1 ATP-binding protein [Arthrobacter silviterrae]